MFKAILRENAGALATDTARDLSAWLTIAANVSAAPILRSLDLANRTVYDALVEIANASANDAATPTWLGFDIALANQLTGLLEFRTYTGQRGVDHRFPGGNPPLLLSPEAGNLDTVQTGTLYRESVSYIYAAGAGIGPIRATATASDAALIALGPFGRRCRPWLTPSRSCARHGPDSSWKRS